MKRNYDPPHRYTRLLSGNLLPRSLIRCAGGVPAGVLSDPVFKQKTCDAFEMFLIARYFGDCLIERNATSGGPARPRCRSMFFDFFQEPAEFPAFKAEIIVHL